MRIAYLGTPDFAVPPLLGLIEAGYEIPLVMTQPDRARDRGKVTVTPVKQAALDHGLRVLTPEKLRTDQDAIQALREAKLDLIVVAAFGQILSKEVLALPRLGCVNIHASLLPRFRGAAPIQAAILAGDAEAGVTLMQMEEGLDTGAMLAKGKVPIGRMTGGQLHDALAEIGAKLLLENLPAIAAGTIVSEPQDDSLSTYAGMIRKEDGYLQFDQEDAAALDRKIRAFDPWPGTWCDYQGQRMKIRQAVPLAEEATVSPGQVVRTSEAGIDVACQRGLLRIEVLQMPGKKALSAADFLRGHSLPPGTKLGE